MRTLPNRQVILFFIITCLPNWLTFAQSYNGRANYLDRYLDLLVEDMNRREVGLKGLNNKQRLEQLKLIKTYTNRVLSPEEAQRRAELNGFSDVAAEKIWQQDWNLRMRKLMKEWRKYDTSFFSLPPEQQRELYKEAIHIKQRNGSYPIRN
jgi:hypothetical protein